MVKRLTQITDATFEEARVLLDINEWDIESAVAEQEAWNEQEDKLRGKPRDPPAATLKEFLYIQASRPAPRCSGPSIFPFLPK